MPTPTGSAAPSSSCRAGGCCDGADASRRRPRWCESTSGSNCRHDLPRDRSVWCDAWPPRRVHQDKFRGCTRGLPVATEQRGGGEHRRGVGGDRKSEGRSWAGRPPEEPRSIGEGCHRITVNSITADDESTSEGQRLAASVCLVLTPPGPQGPHLASFTGDRSETSAVLKSIRMTAGGPGRGLACPGRA